MALLRSGRHRSVAFAEIISWALCELYRVPVDIEHTADFWATSLHEHAHWTGHASRLDRPGITDFSGFGSEAYAFEELCAEIGAAFVCKHIGVTRTGLFENHVAYLASWKKKLEDDPSAIRRAIQEAGKIMRHIVK